MPAEVAAAEEEEAQSFADVRFGGGPSEFEMLGGERHRAVGHTAAPAPFAPLVQALRYSCAAAAAAATTARC